MKRWARKRCHEGPKVRQCKSPGLRWEFVHGLFLGVFL
jgi:hypothetical protein